MRFILLLFILSPAFAQNFCERSQADLIALLENPLNRIAFNNQGGLVNGGVCWWHSRLQRSSAYLAKFSPNASKPTSLEAKNLLISLRRMDKVVEIPGFKNFSEFTKTYQNETQKVLEGWQRADGFINQQWIRGISGNSRLHPNILKKRMKTIYEFYQSSPVPVWLMAQIKGIVSHSYLLLGMKLMPNGFELELIDSNKANEIRFVTYQEGMTYLRLDRYKFIPYVGFQKDFTKIKTAIEDECNVPLKDLWGLVPNGEIEID